MQSSTIVRLNPQEARDTLPFAQVHTDITPLYLFYRANFPSWGGGKDEYSNVY
eukprot:m.28740 g.28740  ORF g.28740 m.28740 type:complete len:53 (-) comp9073_c0_seq1:3-161(-)